MSDDGNVRTTIERRFRTRALETPDGLERTAARLRTAGCIAPEAEALQLVEAVAGDMDLLDELVARRARGEPLAWLTGRVRFGGETVLVRPGVYVPRPQTEALALEAAARLPEHGLAADLCTGSGAVAVVLRRRRPAARIVATDIDPRAIVNARANGVETYWGDMADGLPRDVAGRLDVVTAVVPYVPTAELRLLPRDVVAYEPRRSLDGGADGADLLVRAAVESAPLLRRDGSLLLELGGEQAESLRPLLRELGYREVRVLRDPEGDPRAVVARR